jgi:hypothetical protein
MPKTSHRRHRRGVTMVEVLVGSLLMLMLLVAFYAIAEMLGRSQIASDARLEARQQLRNATRAYALATSQANGYYEATASSDTTDIGGYTCQLPFFNTSTQLFEPGDTIAVAVPIDRTRPEDPADDPRDPDTVLASAGTPDGFPDNKYSVVVLTSRPMTPPDSRNPQARQLVILRWDNLTPVGFQAPLTIDLETLGTPTVERVFDAYLEPLTSDGFRVNYLRKGSVAAASSIHAEFSYQPRQGAVQAESYEYLFNTRNMF